MSQQQIQRVAPDKLEPFRQALAASEESFKRALPSTVAKYLTPERITKMTLTAISKTPQLLLCTRESILRAVMEAVSLGLEPAGPLGHAYLVPFANNKKDAQGNWQKVNEAQLVIGYRGFICLARRSGEIQSVNANVIYSRDRFHVNLAESLVEHEPYMPAMPTPEEAEANNLDPIELMHRGQPVAVYSVAHFVGGGRHVDFMTIGDVERIRARSRAADNGPWMTDYDEMARKTVVRRAAKYWPLSTEMARALEVDNDTDAAIAPSSSPFSRSVVRELPQPAVVKPVAEAAKQAAPPDEQTQEPAAVDGPDLPDFDAPDAPSEPEEAQPQSATKRVLSKVRKQENRQPGEDG